MTSAVAPSAVQQINRFRVQRPLGYGAQGVVYVAHDPELDRQVAIKTLLGTRDADQAQMLIASAKMASSLSHPNIVPVFEVGMDAAQPYVVFEYVEGKTLAALLQSQGALSMAQAVVMMSQILAGMAHVHASGLLHGDIKPANILIGANGIPRVTDFGISRRAVAAAGETVNSGTVQYMAPECLSEGRADYRSDVFALGLTFHEMLTGKPAFEGGNDYALMYRILNEAPPPPSAFNPRIDRRLDEIVLKALARDPAQRYPDAGQMKLELDRFRVPQASARDSELKERPLHGTVEYLLRRMAFKSEFPALSASFTRINQLAAREDEASTKAISDLVMRDFALTQKLLRIVNSSAYGAGKVTRISQAITILGLSQLRAVATGMMLASGRTGPKRAAIESTITESFVAGVIARNIGRMLGFKGAEELFICGMFSRLGELLTLNYLGDDHDIIMAMIADEGLDAATASQQVLGLSFDQLGAEVAAHWKFPELIVQALQALPAGRVAPAETDAERMRLCTAYARELCAFARVSSAGSREREFENHRRRYADAVAVDPAQVRLLIGHSVKAALQYVKASGLTVAKTPLLPAMRALAEQPAPSGAQAGAAGDSVAASDAVRGARYGALNAAACELPPATVAAVPSAVLSAEPKPRTTSGTGAVAALIRAWRALF